MRSLYLTAEELRISFDFQVGFVECAEDMKPSSDIRDKGEFNSSSSSSLVYAFLTTEDLLFLSLDSLPTSPIMLAMEDAVGGKYTMGGAAMHGKFLTDSPPSSKSISSYIKLRRKIKIIIN